MRFYLTDEECKYGHNLATGNINVWFYLTDEECKCAQQLRPLTGSAKFLSN